MTFHDLPLGEIVLTYLPLQGKIEVTFLPLQGKIEVTFLPLQGEIEGVAYLAKTKSHRKHRKHRKLFFNNELHEFHEL